MDFLLGKRYQRFVKFVFDILGSLQFSLQIVMVTFIVSSEILALHQDSIKY